MKIAIARESHIPGIIEVWEELMDLHKDIDHRFPLKQNAHLNFKKHLMDLLRSEDTQVLVSLDDSQIVGFSISQISRYPPIFKQEIYGLISDMAVKTKFRRKGIGERMLNRIYTWFESQNINKIELSVAAKNQIGYSFWKKHGFQDYIHRLYLKT